MKNRIEDLCGTLADPVRRKVVEVLCAGPRCAGDLAQTCRVTPPAMSRHLRLLRQSGFVEGAADEVDARVRMYRLRAAPLADLRQWLDAVEAAWSDQLQAFKAHVEAKVPRKRR